MAPSADQCTDWQWQFAHLVTSLQMTFQFRRPLGQNPEKKGWFSWIVFVVFAINIFSRDTITLQKSALSHSFSCLVTWIYCIRLFHKLWSFIYFFSICGIGLFLVFCLSMCYLLSLQRRAVTAWDQFRPWLWWPCHSVGNWWAPTGLCPVAAVETHKKAESALTWVSSAFSGVCLKMNLIHIIRFNTQSIPGFICSPVDV